MAPAYGLIVLAKPIPAEIPIDTDHVDCCITPRHEDAEDWINRATEVNGSLNIHTYIHTYLTCSNEMSRMSKKKN